MRRIMAVKKQGTLEFNAKGVPDTIDHVNSALKNLGKGVDLDQEIFSWFFLLSGYHYMEMVSVSQGKAAQTVRFVDRAVT